MAGDAAFDGAETALRADEARSEFLPHVVGGAAVLAVTLFCGWRFAGLVDPALLRPWLAAMTIPPLGVFVVEAARRIRQPGDTEIVRVWSWIARGLRLTINLAVIASPWILLPNADAPLRNLMLMLYIWFLATEVFAATDRDGMTWVGLAGVPLSTGIYLLNAHVPYALPLTIFLLLAGLTLFGLDRLMRRARLRTEAAILTRAAEATALRDELAERDDRPIAASHRDPLTPRQIEVARLLAEGLSNKEIAQVLDVSPATIKAHVAQVIAVTGARNRTGASARAREMGLL